jgi:hypothetical protein
LLLIALLLAVTGAIMIGVSWPAGFRNRWPETVFGAVALIVARVVLGEAESLSRHKETLLASQTLPYLPMP